MSKIEKNQVAQFSPTLNFEFDGYENKLQVTQKWK